MCRDPWSVISNYHTATTAINQALTDMYAGGQGQHRLGIAIYHRTGGADCVSNKTTNMDSSGGVLRPQCKTNLINLLSQIKAKGFLEVEVTFYPQADNNPQYWPGGWQSNPYYFGLYQENWNLIVNLRRDVFIPAGLNIKYDLLNEGTPIVGSQWQGHLEYVRRLWIDYTGSFGKNDTFGFSIPGYDTLLRTALRMAKTSAV